MGGVHHAALQALVGQGGTVGEGGDDLVRDHLGGEILPHLQQHISIFVICLSHFSKTEVRQGPQGFPQFVYLEPVNSPEEGEVLAVALKEGGAGNLLFLLRSQNRPGSDADQVGLIRDRD